MKAAIGVRVSKTSWVTSGDDQPLYELLLDAEQQAALDEMWREMDFVASINIRTSAADAARLAHPRFVPMVKPQISVIRNARSELRWSGLAEKTPRNRIGTGYVMCVFSSFGLSRAKVRPGEAMAYISGWVLACVLGSGTILAQQSASAEPQQPVAATVEPEAAISPATWAKSLLHDQKPIWTFPEKIIRGKHWKPVLGVALGTAALVVLDPYTEPYFHNPSRFDGYKTGPMRGRNTTLAVTLTPVAFYVVGLAKHSTHAKNTGLLAAEGLVGTQVVSFVMKQAVGRLKPSDIPQDGNLRDTWFKYKGGLTNGGSFPSGHTASAFAVATVIAERYREHRWLPWVAYGTATLLSLSRLPTQAHFPSDIFIGAAMGYSFSHFVVLRR